jgi:PAS domain S-box-containing protein
MDIPPPELVPSTPRRDGALSALLLDAMEDGVCVVDGEFRFVFVNQPLCSLWGRSRHELIGRSAWDTFYGLEATEDGRHLCDAVLSRREVTFDTFSRPARRWVRLRVMPLPDGYAAVQWRDITREHRDHTAMQWRNERLRRQEEQQAGQLARSQARLQAFFDLSPDWLCLFRGRPQGPFRYVDLNRACEEAYGLSREQVIGRTVEEVLGVEAAQVPIRHFRDCLRTDQRQRYAARRTMAGRTRTIDVVFIPVPEEQEGDERFIMSTARDITEREALEAQLRQSQKMEAVGQLTGGIAHDFNNLLTAVISSLELIERHTDKDKVKSLAATALSAAMRGAQLTHQLLALSRRQQLRPAVLDLRTVVADTDVLIRPALGATIELAVSAAPDIWPARADAGQFQAAVMNLLVNARDAMPSGGRITLKLANVTVPDAATAPDLPSGDYVLLIVADEGVGMTTEVLSRATEPFYTTKGIGHGSGLGLSMVHGFATQSGGAMRIESFPGEGTTIRLFLPRACGSVDRTEVTAEGWQRATHPARILFVEDDEGVREAGRETLRALGHHVLVASNGQEGLKLLRTGAQIGVLLADIVMPGGISGIDLAREATRLRPGLPVLLTSGYAADVPARAGTGEFPFIPKPFHPAGLSRKLAALLPHEGKVR